MIELMLLLAAVASIAWMMTSDHSVVPMFILIGLLPITILNLLRTMKPMAPSYRRRRRAALRGCLDDNPWRYYE